MSRGTSRVLAILMLLAAAVPVFPADVDSVPEPTPLGARIPNIEFKDIRYLPRSLDDFGAKKAYVVIATTTSCPLVQRYLPVLSDLEKTYRERGVQFLALNVGAGDTIVEMAAQSVEAGVEFPFGKDTEDCRSARSLGLARTPEAVVLDADRKVRYRGRIDDQFRLGGARPTAKTQPLKDAIEAVLAGREVPLKETPVDGCLVPTRNSEVPTSRGPIPNFAEHITPILRKHCQDCHHAGTEAPFPLITYRDVATQADSIAEVVADRSMPPWFASERHGEFINHRGLSESERETFLAWLRSGMSKGDAAKRTPAKIYHDTKWKVGEPDLILTMPLAHQIPATGFVDYKYAFFPYVFKEDTWVQEVEILPDNQRVVHHANLVFMKMGEKAREENFITGRVPGGDAMVLDEGTAYLIPKGSIVALQIHYTTTGKPEASKISVGFKFPKTPVKKRLYITQVHTNHFAIPPHAPAYPVIARRPLEFDATAIGLVSHMHLRGKDMTFFAKAPDGATETLLLVPNYNFDWQISYRYKPGTKHFRKGSTFEVLAHFDNSEFNPYNPDPSATVRHGEQTVQEMVFGFFFYTRDDENLNLAVNPKTGHVVSPAKDAASD